MERTYSHTTEQLLAAAGDVGGSHPWIARNVNRSRFGCIALALAFIAAGVMEGGHWIVVVFGGLLLFASFTTIPWLIRKEFKRNMQEQFLRSFQHLEMRISCSDKNITEEWDGGRVIGMWDLLETFSETPIHLVLGFREKIWIYVPKNLLDDAFIVDVRARAKERLTGRGR